MEGRGRRRQRVNNIDDDKRTVVHGPLAQHHGPGHRVDFEASQL